MENISLRQNLKESWGLFKVNYKVLLLAVLILGIVSVVGQSKNPIISIITFVLSIIFQMGFIKICFDIIDNKKPEIKTILSQKDKFLKYFLMTILVMVIFAVPSALLAGILFFGSATAIIIYPILIFIVFLLVIPRVMFANLIIIDTNETAWQSIKTSFFITKKTFSKTLLLLCLVIAINILGAIALVVGLFVSIPVSMIMFAKYYRQISSKLMPVVEETPNQIVEVENTVV